jgi:hypothetical protein
MRRRRGEAGVRSELTFRPGEEPDKGRRAGAPADRCSAALRSATGEPCACAGSSHSRGKGAKPIRLRDTREPLVIRDHSLELVARDRGDAARRRQVDCIKAAQRGIGQSSRLDENFLVPVA